MRIGGMPLVQSWRGGWKVRCWACREVMLKMGERNSSVDVACRASPSKNLSRDPTLAG